MAKIILVVPFPRYVVGKCCGDSQHITNFGSSGFWSELERPETSVSSAILSLEYDRPLTVFNIREVIGDTVLADMAEMEEAGTHSVWQPGDPVHFTPEVYMAIGKALSAGDDADKRGKKRARLESVVAQAGPPAKRGGGQVRLPDWLSGKPGPGADLDRGRGRGRGRGVNRVWRSARGAWRRPRRF